jgi:pyruvate dehydrogenase E2 component (dihydrolipoamide acetyltransferase)
MATEVKMPQLGETVVEGTITKWLKSEGDTVEEDELLVEISTDKVDSEVPSSASGTIQKILVQEGETVSVGTPLAVIGEGDAASGSEGDASDAEQADAEQADAGDAPAAAAPAAESSTDQPGRPRGRPATRALREWAPAPKAPAIRHPAEP